MNLKMLVSLGALGAGLMAATAASAAVTFTGPAGWKHVDQPNSDGVHKFDQWRLTGDPPQTVTVIQDSSMSFADALASVRKNFADNHIRPGIDKDEMCLGRPSHTVEFTVGPEQHEITVNRMIVPDGTGVVTITYARGKDFDYDADAKKALTAFCAQPS